MQETKVKKFIYKGQYLDVELNETNELYDIYNDMFKKDFFYELSYLRKRNEKLEKFNSNQQNDDNNSSNEENNNDENDCNDLEEQEVNNDNPSTNEDDDDLNKSKNIEDNLEDNLPINLQHKFMKILYRKITIKTHPDKTKDTDLHEIFKQADVAYKEENLLDLLIIAIQLRIKYPALNFDFASKLELDIKLKENKINDIKSTIAWNWGSKCDEPEEREKLKKYLYGIWGLPDDFLDNNNYKI